MGVLKAYDCIAHDLLIAKLECYEVDKIGLPLLLDYLSRRRQCTKMFFICFWYDIVWGVPHGLIFEPLIFNLLINDLFFITISELCNFVDKNTLNSLVFNELNVGNDKIKSSTDVPLQ